MVLNGEFTLGQLIAFRIISGYVTQPILRLSTIWQQYREIKISFERLGDIVNTPKENESKDNSVKVHRQGEKQIQNNLFILENK